MYDGKATELHEKKIGSTIAATNCLNFNKVVRKKSEKKSKLLFSREFRPPKIRHTKYTKHRTTANKTHNYAHTKFSSVRSRFYLQILLLRFAQIDLHFKKFPQILPKNVFQHNWCKTYRKRKTILLMLLDANPMRYLCVYITLGFLALTLSPSLLCVCLHQCACTCVRERASVYVCVRVSVLVSMVLWTKNSAGGL